MKRGGSHGIPLFFIGRQWQQQQRTIRAMIMIQQQLLSPSRLPKQLFIMILLTKLWEGQVLSLDIIV